MKTKNINLGKLQRAICEVYKTKLITEPPKDELSRKDDSVWKMVARTYHGRQQARLVEYNLSNQLKNKYFKVTEFREATLKLIKPHIEKGTLH